MLQIVISAFISLGMILGAFNYTEQHNLPKFGASQTISSLTALTSPAYDDVLPITDTSPTPTTKKMTWAVATSSIKTDFDSVYSSKFTTSAGLASILSDETGSGGGFVRATAPTIDSAILTTSANIAAPTFDVAGTDATGDIWYRNSGGLMTRLAMPVSSGYYLTGSTTLGFPQWDNNILSSTNNSAVTFNATTTFNGISFIGQFAQYLASTTINTSTGPVPVFVGTSTNALNISEADVATTTDFLGFATSSNVTNGATTTIQISGIVSGFSGLTAGRAYYVQDTRGTIGTTVGTAEAYVGTALSATQLLMDRKDATWQYLGSATCSLPANTGSSVCDIAAPSPFARFITVNTQVSAGGGACGTLSFTANLLLMKVGQTSQNQNWGVYCNSSNIGNGQVTGQITSTSSVRISTSITGSSGTFSGTETAYFYR